MTSIGNNLINTTRNTTVVENGSQWAQSIKERYPRSVEYFLKFGSPFEKRLTKAVIDLAGGKP
ncbi:MAG: hypothetical protein JXA38_05640 [Methanosarcinaceae archaeon]|nr:hypothetical protein [Methanosarcinaceae archaeon]